MTDVVYSVDNLLGMCQIFNAGLFLFQLAVLMQKRNVTDISLMTFFGFVAVQMMTVLHGYIYRDNILTYSAIANLGLCVSIIVTAFYFRLQKSKKVFAIMNKIPLHNKHGQVTGLLNLSMNIAEMKKIQQGLDQMIEKTNAANAMSYQPITNEITKKMIEGYLKSRYRFDKSG